MAANNMHNLTTLIKRLEAATSRLEDIASSASSFDPSQPAAGVATSAASTGVGATTKTPAPASTAPSKPATAPLPPSIEAYDEIINGKNGVKAWQEKSAKLDPVVADQASGVLQAFQAQRVFLLVSTKAKKPDMMSSQFMELLRDLQAAIEKINEVKDRNRNAQLRDHLSLVADSVIALSWITLDTSPKPNDYIAELFGGAQMYGNKILKQKDPLHVEWVQAYYQIFKDLRAYVLKHHEKGVAWNKSGIDAGEALKQANSQSSSTNGIATAGGPPPPPPPPPLPSFDAPPPPPMPAPGATSSAGDMNAVFDQLNRGSEVTKGLKKVETSQMTHKNPSLRASSAVPERSDSSSGRGKSPAPPGKKPKPESMRQKKPPKKELDGNKWIIENFDKPSDVVEIEASMIQSILITKCNNTTIRIKGKANAISLDNSSRASIVLDSLVSSLDVIKCQNFAVQVLGTIPTLLLDQIEGGTIYLSKDSLNTEIFTSKCTSINVNLPPEDDAGDYTEHAAPEQIRTYVENGRLISEIVEHAG